MQLTSGPAPRASRVVVKLGTAVLTRPDGQVALGRLTAFVESLAALRRGGRDVVLVTSGAVGLGRARLGAGAGPRPLALTQACAAVGQGRLMALYAETFDRLGATCAQVLLTGDDFADPRRYRTLRGTLSTLLELGVVPVINENDVVATAELEPVEPGTAGVEFGDNDQLSALVAGAVHAELLVILTDVAGLFTADPRGPGSPRLIPVVERVTPELMAGAGGPRAGRGGMRAKLEAARVAARCGCATVVASGLEPDVLGRLFAGEALGTLVLAEPEPPPALERVEHRAAG